jgi:nicotinic acid mononucleotide adenylyltransferase
VLGGPQHAGYHYLIVASFPQEIQETQGEILLQAMERSLSLPPLEPLLRGEIPWLYHTPSGDFLPSPEPPRCLFPGSFNPLHRGHLRMMAVVLERFGSTLDFELSVTNVDKPPLTPDTIFSRLLQFREQAGVYLTQAPTFLEKARLFPNCRFVIGVDTAQRLLNPKYYQNQTDLLDRSLNEIRSLGGSFLVFGRLSQGKFQTGWDLEISAQFSDLFLSLSEADFREDISSTEIRNRISRESLSNRD